MGGLRGQCAVRIELAGDAYLRSGLGDAGGTDGNGQAGERAGDDVVVVVDGVALNELAGAADELVLAVELEGAVAGVDLLGALAEDEEAVALDGEVGVDTGGFEGAVGEVFGDGAGGGPEADLEGVGAAEVAGGGGTEGEVLEELGFEIEGGGLEADGVDVGDVVTDDADLLLAGGETAEGGVEGGSNAGHEDLHGYGERVRMDHERAGNLKHDVMEWTPPLRWITPRTRLEGRLRRPVKRGYGLTPTPPLVPTAVTMGLP